MWADADPYLLFELILIRFGIFFYISKTILIEKDKLYTQKSIQDPFLL
jgi:hypothetical protein